MSAVGSECESGEESMCVDVALAESSTPTSLSPSSTCSVRIQAHSEHYRLQWQDHQVHLLDYFDSLYQTERMVDVTLVSRDVSVRAHKVVLSACSSYLQRLLADNPCSHPIIILQDVSGWQLQALIAFMYRGEINVPHQHIPSLIKVAESLKIRGLAKLEASMSTKPRNSSPPPLTPLIRDPLMYRPDSLIIPASSSVSRDYYSSTSKLSPTPAKVPHLTPGQHNGYSFDSHTSPLPRRKQARPRRRSGDSSCTPPMDISCKRSTPSPVQDAPEDLSVKKSPVVSMRQESEDTNQDSSRDNTPLPATSLKAESVTSDSIKSDFSLAERNSLFSPGPSAPIPTPPTPTLPTLPSLTSLSSLTPSSALASFTSLASLTHSAASSHPSPAHQDRRKGQHSAPRGGPPRAWTNSDLTEALNHVWNRKMTTSQASRVFGIPYNSLLMYVRGKYGKSLKLDTLRKETLEGEAMALAASTRGSYKLAAAAASAGSGSKNSSGTKTTSTTPVNGDSLSKNNNDKVTDKHTGNNNNNNNNNDSSKNNNKNTPDSKVSKAAHPISHLHLGGLNLGAYPAGLPQIGEVDPHSLSAQLGLGLGGFGGLASAGINPYLSYFCDFSFPIPTVGLHGNNGTGGGISSSAPAGKGQRSSSITDGSLLKKSDSRSAKLILGDDVKRSKSIPSESPILSGPTNLGHDAMAGSISSDPEADNKEDSVTTEEEGPSPPPPAVNLRLASSLLSPLDLPQTGQV